MVDGMGPWKGHVLDGPGVGVIILGIDGEIYQWWA